MMIKFLLISFNIFSCTDEIPWGVKWMGGPDFENRKKYCVIDTGYDIDHPDLIGQVVKSIDMTGSKSGVNDKHGHGTHVLGVLAAKADNQGIIGLAPNASYYVCKSMNDKGIGYSSTSCKCIDWCIENDVDEINASWGSEKENSRRKRCVKKALDKGIKFNASAGNRGRRSKKMSYPACTDPRVTVIGAIDKNGRRAKFSSTRGCKVDIYAPGVRIKSTYPGGKYQILSGTSMAVGHAAVGVSE